MVDELDQVEKEDLPESQPGGENPPATGEPEVQEEVTRLESLVARKDEELSRADARLNELEQAVAGKDDEIANLEQARGELEEKFAALNSSLAQAITGYREMVVQANPEIIEELISGDTIESINESLDRARALVSKVRQGVETEISLTRIPAGAPERTSPDLSALSPREKIQYAIGKIK